MKLLVVSLIASAAAASSAQQDESVTIVIPPEQVAKCEAEGGCTLVTRALLEKLVELAKRNTCGLKEI